MTVRSESSIMSARNSRTVLAEQVRLQVALGHFLNAEVAMGRSPATVGGVVFQNPIISGSMISFTHVAEKNALIGFAAYDKANGVPKILSGMPGAFAGIAQIAGLVQLLRAGNLAFVAGSRTVTFPPASQ